jgi:hypothetical protein
MNEVRSDRSMCWHFLFLQWTVALVDWALGLVFGRDIFISYSRKGSAKYAPALVLGLKQRNQKLTFYLNRWIARLLPAFENRFSDIFVGAD